ncbi:hormogonium polysaccharide biosynthesis glycosyltransferase HpsE [Phormidium yuhuli AB48]|uniref:Hormogonium polysaccharide biosynthesis glycosyltransferase HpsE n=1 Tax=Phormidium yuhuli AB48 TaxID=2940671 RepID=A0ABY5AQC1_9CYAN|nr:hormogonium polysaccharide biosynthesis glycosyltransferase HpsE [Phormidium yuhuli]USR91427.1 hormogonium polysaccharide biosynthesis glycosyltransferase HpsE [Phormidium yuhuli AB48]
MDFTVAICTYNGEQRVLQVLDALARQQGTEGISWEVLVVDNNSGDRTAEVVQAYDWASRGPRNSRLRWLLEPRQGTAYARRRAMEEAASEDWVGFLDDDNLPGETWVKEAFQFGCDRPEIGAYGGIIHGKLDAPPPEYFNAIKLRLAVYNRGDRPFCYARSAKPRIVPAAPGSVIRKQAWRDCIPERLLLQGRDEAGQTYVGACEDLETLFYIQNSDWQIWHNPNMEIWHHLPPSRLERDYLLKISRTAGLSNHALRIARLGNKVRLLMPLYLLSDGLKLVSYYLKYRSEVQEDIIKACELQERLGRFLSPFYVG